MERVLGIGNEMIEHDSSKRAGHGGFRHYGTGHVVTRTCGRCGKPGTNRGGSRHKVLGWIGACCTPANTTKASK